MSTTADKPLTRITPIRLSQDDYNTLVALARRSGVRPSAMVRILIRTVGELAPLTPAEAAPVAKRAA